MPGISQFNLFGEKNPSSGFGCLCPNPLKQSEMPAVWGKQGVGLPKVIAREHLCMRQMKPIPFSKGLCALVIECRTCSYLLAIGLVNCPL